MKFFLLSLIINIILLLLPLRSTEIVNKQTKPLLITLHVDYKKSIDQKKEKEKKQIKVKKKTNSTIKKKQNNTPSQKKINKPLHEKKIIKTKKNERKKIPHKKKIQDADKKNIHEKIVQKKKKIAHLKSDKKHIQVEKTNKSKRTYIKSEESTMPKIINEAKISQKPQENATKNTTCKENVDFKVIQKPSTSYPRKALLLRIRKTTIVEVFFQIDANGKINILNVKGGSKIFQNEATKRTKGMKIKLLHKNATKCTIIQPFKFIP